MKIIQDGKNVSARFQIKESRMEERRTGGGEEGETEGKERE